MQRETTTTFRTTFRQHTAGNDEREKVPGWTLSDLLPTSWRVLAAAAAAALLSGVGRLDGIFDGRGGALEASVSVEEVSYFPRSCCRRGVVEIRRRDGRIRPVDVTLEPDSNAVRGRLSSKPLPPVRPAVRVHGTTLLPYILLFRIIPV